MKKLRNLIGLGLLTFTFQYSALVVFTSGWNYRLVDGQIKRAWFVLLPGRQYYTNLDDVPSLRYEFTMRAPYRVSPWFDPEWTDESL